MEDATELCDRVAFIVEGEAKALDTPHNLIMQHGASKVRYTFIGDDGRECEEVNDLLGVVGDALQSGYFEKDLQY